ACGGLHAALVAHDHATRCTHEQRVPRARRYGVAPHFRKTTSDKIIDWNIREMNGRAVSPSEVATTLAFLGPPAASYVNGVNLDIDAGFSAALATGQVDFSGRT